MNTPDRQLVLRHNNLNAAKTAFLLCDMQEKLLPAMFSSNEILEIGKRMVEAAKVLNIPLVVTEQVKLSF